MLGSSPEIISPLPDRVFDAEPESTPYQQAGSNSSAPHCAEPGGIELVTELLEPGKNMRELVFKPQVFRSGIPAFL
jgi:hypothetical protein